MYFHDQMHFKFILFAPIVRPRSLHLVIFSFFVFFFLIAYIIFFAIYFTFSFRLMTQFFKALQRMHKDHINAVLGESTGIFLLEKVYSSHWDIFK